MAVLTITMEADNGGVGLVCATCAALEGQEAEALILRALSRDLGLENATPVPASAFAPGGRA